MKLWIESNHRNSLLFFLQILLYAGNVGALWPLPKELSHGTSTVWLSPAVELSVVDRRTAAGPFAAFWGLKPFGWLSKSAQAVLYDIFVPYSKKQFSNLKIDLIT